jgi:hypothetical protein
MHYLSRRLSGLIYLYIVIASLIHSIVFNFFYTDFLGRNASLFTLLFRIIIYLPPIIYIIIKKYPLQRIARINKFTFKQLLFVIGISICTYVFVILFRSLIENLFISSLTSYSPEFFNSYGFDLWPSILTTCVIYSLLHVTTFQGAVQSGFYKLNPLKACLIIGFLFSLLTGDFSKLLPYTLFGFVISYIVVKTNSIFSGIILGFFFYFFRQIGLESILYFNCLSPLSISQDIGVMILIALSVIFGGILLKKMPETTPSASKPFDKSVLCGLGRKILRFRKSMQLSWYKEDNSQQAATQEKQPVQNSSFNTGIITIYPDDSEKQKRNTGLIAGIVIQVILLVIQIVSSIYSIFSSYNTY